MSDRIDHRVAAERILGDAALWAAQAEEPMPEAGELSCLAYATVHALLAIADRLAEAAPKPNNVTVVDSGLTVPDPLDENDHRDRLDTDGDRLSRRANGLWSFWDEVGMFTLASAEERHGPLRFAVDEPQEAASSHETPPSTPAGPEDKPVDGSESQRRNLNAQRGESDALQCPECGHGISRHGTGRGCVAIVALRPLGECECSHGPQDVARVLIDRAVQAERKKLAQEVRYAASESQRRGELSAFDRRTDEWEAR